MVKSVCQIAIAARPCDEEPISCRIELPQYGAVLGLGLALLLVQRSEDRSWDKAGLNSSCNF